MKFLKSPTRSRGLALTKPSNIFYDIVNGKYAVQLLSLLHVMSRIIKPVPNVN